LDTLTSSKIILLACQTSITEYEKGTLCKTGHTIDFPSTDSHKTGTMLTEEMEQQKKKNKDKKKKKEQHTTCIAF
jgi:hypothetical protein